MRTDTTRLHLRVLVALDRLTVELRNPSHAQSLCGLWLSTGTDKQISGLIAGPKSVESTLASEITGWPRWNRAIGRIMHPWAKRATKSAYAGTSRGREIASCRDIGDWREITDPEDGHGLESRNLPVVAALRHACEDGTRGRAILTRPLGRRGVRPADRYDRSVRYCRLNGPLVHDFRRLALAGVGSTRRYNGRSNSPRVPAGPAARGGGMFAGCVVAACGTWRWARPDSPEGRPAEARSGCRAGLRFAGSPTSQGGNRK